ncbi:MAG: sulfotransferase [Pararhodobacter sp.]|nr:sulfotransferase [Pararhodobacter sp.]
MKPTIIYILGSGHSGTTLANLLLGQHPEVESCGVIKKLGRFARREKHNGECNCGEPLESCPVWGQVLATLDANGIDPEMLHERNASSPDFGRAHLLTLNAIQNVTGSRFFVDKSLNLKRLEALQQISDINCVVVHCVRDPRAVAMSNARKGRNYQEWIDTWQKENAVCVAFQGSAGKTLPWYVLKYEELARNPEQEMRNICAIFTDTPFQHSDEAWKKRTRHDIGGNRMGRNEDTEIRVDTGYLDLVSDTDWIAANKTTLDLLQHFGYLEDRDGMRIRLAT